MKNFKFVFTVVLIVFISLPVTAQHAKSNNGQEKLTNDTLNQNALNQVAIIHGGAGPFAVAGYRMGVRALQELRISRGSFSVDVTHETPEEVQWSCMADGLQAATGVSVGKLNLHLVLTKQNTACSTIIDRTSGKKIMFRLKASFLDKFLNTSYDKLKEAGEIVMKMNDDDIFELILNTEHKAKGSD